MSFVALPRCSPSAVSGQVIDPRPGKGAQKGPGAPGAPGFPMSFPAGGPPAPQAQQAQQAQAQPNAWWPNAWPGAPFGKGAACFFALGLVFLLWGLALLPLQPGAPQTAPPWAWNQAQPAQQSHRLRRVRTL